MTVNAFIGLVKRHKMDYIRYCEILIDERGHVILASPSHQEALVKIAARKTKRTPREIKNGVPVDCNPNKYLADKYNIVMVWYSILDIPLNVNDIQIETIRRLTMEKILSDCPKIDYNDEYHKSLWRNKILMM